MESFEVRNNQEILDPDPLYFDFINRQDQSKWEHEEDLGIYFAPEEAIAEFIQEYLQKNSFRHLDIYRYCQKHSGSFTSMLKSYYRRVVRGDDVADVIKKALQLSEDDLVNLAAEIDKEGKKIVEGQEILAREKLVRFPDYLVEETDGVEGYLRQELKWEDLEKLYNALFSKEELKKWTDIFCKLSTDYNSYLRDHEEKYRSFEKIESLESFGVFISIIEDLNGFFNKRHFINEKLSDLKNYLTQEEFDRFQKNIPKASHIFRAILDSLGHNFISNENIHVMNGAWGLSKQEAQEDFQREMMTQKIFDPNDKSVRIDNGNSGQNVIYNVHSIYKPLNSERVVASSIDPDSDRYKNNGPLKKETFLIFADGGLSVSNGGIWTMDGRDDSRLGVLRPVFGFSSKNKAYIRYLEKYAKLLKDSGLLENKDYERHYLCARDLISSGRSSIYAPFGDTPHPKIPIVIGHPNIPDLRWCHASHAYIPTKNGISVLRMISSRENMESEEKRLKDKIDKVDNN